MFNPAMGAVECRNGEDIFVTTVGSGGYAVFGPYDQLPPGRYVAECRVLAEPDALHSDNVAGWAEVAIEGGTKILAKTSIYPRRQRPEGKIFMPFRLDEPAAVEVRVHTLGRVPFAINLARQFREMPDEEVNFSPVLEPETQFEDAFFLTHLNEFAGLYETGAIIEPNAEGTLVTMDGLTFRAKDVEVFQVAREVFKSNDYTLRSSRPKIAIDVGMNVGLASLRLASDALVTEVHSFEPFSTPFERARENFRLNPALTAKINPHPFGLSDTDETFDVMVEEDETIGTSIKGRESGHAETIQVRDAATVLEPIFRKALADGADIVMKIDCEGSEFAIFRTLEKAGLLTLVKTFMIEWHKWWSPDCSRGTLLAPLIAGGYTIFDHADPTDLWAGHIYAVR